MKRTIHNPVLNDTVTFFQTAAESHEAITELGATVMPGGSNPPHFHTTYDETVTVLEGRVLLQLAKGTEVELSSGDTYLIKAGQVHGFRNATEAPIRVVSRITPGSKGFKDVLRIMYGLASDGVYSARKMPRSFQHSHVSVRNWRESRWEDSSLIGARHTYADIFVHHLRSGVTISISRV